MAMVLQQTLRGLCYKTGWCYAVFWKLKRRNRMVLTWEDGYYEHANSSTLSNFNCTTLTSLLTYGSNSSQIGGKPLEHCATGQGNSEDQIEVAVAKMSYHVYSLGEGIIGRVAFTSKHQWVFSGGDKAACPDGNSSSKLNGRNAAEKYPAGWQNQFAAGIKTIAIVAVPQGVIQLGSTQMIPEDLNLVGHIKAMFGTLQSVPGAFLSDLVPEAPCGTVQGPYPIAIPIPHITPIGPPANSAIPHMTPIGPPSTNSAIPTVFRAQPSFMRLGAMATVGINPIGGSSFSLARVGQLPMLMASQKVPLQMQLSPSVPVGMQGMKVPCAQQQKFDSHERCSSFPATSRSIDISIDDTKVKLSSLKVPPRTGIISRFALTGKSSIAASSAERSNSSMVFQRKSLETNSQLHPQDFSSQVLPLSQIQRDSPSSFHSTSITLPSWDGSSQVGLHSENQYPLFSNRDGPSSSSAAIDANATTSTQEVSQTMAVSGSDYSLAVDASSAAGKKQMQAHQPGASSTIPVIESYTPSTAPGPFPGTSLSSQPHVPALETKISCSPSWSVDNNLNFQISDLLLLSDHGESSHKLSFADHLSFEKEVPNKAPNISCDNVINDLFPLKSMLENSEPTFGESCSQPDGNGVINEVLDDFDEYFASLTREHDKQRDCFATLGLRFAVGDELSEALFSSAKRISQSVCLEKPDAQQNEEQIKEKFGVETPGLAIVQVRDEAFQDVSFSSTFELPVHNFTGAQETADRMPEPLLGAVVAGGSLNKPASLDSDGIFLCKSSIPNPVCVIPTPDVLSKSCASMTTGSVFQQGNASSKPAARFSPCEESHDADVPQRDDGKKKGWIEQFSITGGNNLVEEDFKSNSQSAKSLEGLKYEETLKTGRKRARPGEIGKPRPKDRQQIQDRVRELRDIIPNATKCSIDALLERTIKYVNFLRTVTQHAEKWMQKSKFEASGCNTRVAPDNSESGASWAVELGVQGVDCPIIVENLNQSRQMLVEMLCEEKGVFLEIADTIRGLGLTILKGVMESKSNKIWARFVVEAAHEVHRVEVLCSLIQLFQPDTKPTSSLTNQACAWTTTH